MQQGRGLDCLLAAYLWYEHRYDCKQSIFRLCVSTYHVG